METQNKTQKRKLSKSQLNYKASKRETFKSKEDYFLDSLMTEYVIDYSNAYEQKKAKYQTKSTKQNPYNF